MKMEDVTRAIENALPVILTHRGITTGGYLITAVITRYDRGHGWKYSLELMDKSRCLVIASPEDVKLEGEK
jgi:hypothetical protein